VVGGTKYILVGGWMGIVKRRPTMMMSQSKPHYSASSMTEKAGIASIVVNSKK